MKNLLYDGVKLIYEIFESKNSELILKLSKLLDVTSDDQLWDVWLDADCLTESVIAGRGERLNRRHWIKLFRNARDRNPDVRTPEALNTGASIQTPPSSIPAGTLSDKLSAPSCSRAAVARCIAIHCINNVPLLAFIYMFMMAEQINE